MLGGENREGVPKLPEEIEISTPDDQSEGLPHPNRDQVAGKRLLLVTRWMVDAGPGGEDEVDDVEGGEDNHHEQHGVDGKVPMEVSTNIISKAHIL